MLAMRDGLTLQSAVDPAADDMSACNEAMRALLTGTLWCRPDGFVLTADAFATAHSAAPEEDGPPAPGLDGAHDEEARRGPREALLPLAATPS